MPLVSWGARPQAVSIARALGHAYRPSRRKVLAHFEPCTLVPHIVRFGVSCCHSIGFKACHKRFGHVVCSDAEWAFAFREPSQAEAAVVAADGPPLPPSGWVLLPQWSPRTQRPIVGCAFDLLAPRGGLAALQRDVRWLPPSVPPLLARTALAPRLADAGNDPTQNTWELQWVGETLRCALTLQEGPSCDRMPGHDQGKGGTSTSAACSITVARGGRPPQRWQFLSLSFQPDREAWAACVCCCPPALAALTIQLAQSACSRIRVVSCYHMSHQLH